MSAMQGLDGGRSGAKAGFPGIRSQLLTRSSFNLGVMNRRAVGLLNAIKSQDGLSKESSPG